MFHLIILSNFLLSLFEHKRAAALSNVLILSRRQAFFVTTMCRRHSGQTGNQGSVLLDRDRREGRFIQAADTGACKLAGINAVFRDTCGV